MSTPSFNTLRNKPTLIRRCDSIIPPPCSECLFVVYAWGDFVHGMGMSRQIFNSWINLRRCLLCVTSLSHWVWQCARGVGVGVVGKGTEILLGPGLYNQVPVGCRMWSGAQWNQGCSKGLGVVWWCRVRRWYLQSRISCSLGFNINWSVNSFHQCHQHSLEKICYF